MPPASPGEVTISRGAVGRTEARQVTAMRAAAKLLAQDAAADWLFLLPNLVVTTAKVEGVPQNATTLSFDLSSITKNP